MKLEIHAYSCICYKFSSPAKNRIKMGDVPTNPSKENLGNHIWFSDEKVKLGTNIIIDIMYTVGDLCGLNSCLWRLHCTRLTREK